MFDTASHFLNEALINASSVTEVLDDLTQNFKNCEDPTLSALADKLKDCFESFSDDLLNTHEMLFSNLYNEITNCCPNIKLSFESRRKSILSTLKKILSKPLLYILQDIYASRIIVYGDNEDEAIDKCYKVAETVISYFISNGYTLCPAKYTASSAFNQDEHPNVVVPKCSGLPENLQSNVEDYILYPKQNWYQSLHLTVKTPSGVYIELQIRTAAMHEFAVSGAACHKTYKKETYSELYFNRALISIPGYTYTKADDGMEIISDTIGFEQPLVIFKQSNAN